METDSGLVLVDTGIGALDVQKPARLDMAGTALHQVKALGYAPEDVRDVVVTHLDLDHAGGLPDFPGARVHVYAPEYEAALHSRRLKHRLHYRRDQFSHEPKWTVHETAGEQWYGFDAVRALPGGDHILLVPLTGHSPGHAGVAVRIGDGWLLHSGDAYFYHRKVNAETPYCTPGLRVFQSLIQDDGRVRHANQARLRSLVRDNGEDDVQLFCDHDPVELAQYA